MSSLHNRRRAVLHNRRRAVLHNRRRAITCIAAGSCVMSALADAAGSNAASPITAIAFSPDRKRIIAGSQSGLTVFDLAGKPTRSIPVEMDNVHSLQFSPNGKTLAVGGGHPAETGVIELLEWPSAERQNRWTLHDDVIYQIQYSPDGTRCVAASGDGVCSVMTMTSGETESRFTKHSKAVISAVFLNDRKTIVSGSRDQTLRVWESDSASSIRTLHNHSGDVLFLARKPSLDGLPMVASASADKTVRLWQPTIGRMVRFARLPSEPLCLAWCGDHQLIVGCRDGKARVIDSNTVQLIRTIEISDGWLYCVAACPGDGRLVAFGSDHGKIHLCDLSSNT